MYPLGKDHQRLENQKEKAFRQTDRQEKEQIGPRAHEAVRREKEPREVDATSIKKVKSKTRMIFLIDENISEVD